MKANEQQKGSLDLESGNQDNKIFLDDASSFDSQSAGYSNANSDEKMPTKRNTQAKSPNAAGKISEEEYRRQKSIPGATRAKYEADLKYASKHAGGYRKAYTLKEGLINLVFVLILVGLVLGTIKLVFVSLSDKQYFGPIAFGIIAVYFIGGLMLAALRRHLVVNAVRRDPNAVPRKATVTVCVFKSSHSFGSRRSGQTRHRVTYRVVADVDGRRSATYIANRYFENGEIIDVLYNPKRPMYFCITPIENDSRVKR